MPAAMTSPDASKENGMHVSATIRKSIRIENRALSVLPCKACAVPMPSPIGVESRQCDTHVIPTRFSLIAELHSQNAAGRLSEDFSFQPAADFDFAAHRSSEQVPRHMLRSGSILSSENWMLISEDYPPCPLLFHLIVATRSASAMLSGHVAIGSYYCCEIAAAHGTIAGIFARRSAKAVSGSVEWDPVQDWDVGAY